MVFGGALELAGQLGRCAAGFHQLKHLLPESSRVGGLDFGISDSFSQTTRCPRNPVNSTLIQIICWSFYGTWAIPIIVFIRRMERSVPALTYASLVNVGGGWVFFILIPMTWAVIAFRAETLDPSIIQIMNDWVWFDWLFTWPSFSVWMFIIAAAILCDHNVPTLYPRWVAFFNIWCGILIFPAGLIAFFKKGPFAYDGLISFWFAVCVFFGWMLVMTLSTFKVITAEDRRLAEERAARPLRSGTAEPGLTHPI